MPFSNLAPFSPVQQDFIWVGEYADGTHLSEFDFKTKVENSFYAIQRDYLIRFGLIGHGMRLYYEVFGGTFKVNGAMFELAYRVGEEEYPLTGLPIMYKDIITYKDAQATLNTARLGAVEQSVLQYNFGYKQQVIVKDKSFNFKAICSIPFDSPIFMTFRLVSNNPEDLDGEFVIMRNGEEVDSFHAPLKEGAGGELSWIVKMR